ncbi:MAG: NADH-quinone oxidoreductase subunit NuoK [Vicinamibacteria bacterium]
MTTFAWLVGASLFASGLAMVILRRELIAMLLGVETMIVAVNLALLYTAVARADSDGLASALIIIGVAAAEAAVGLSLILRLHRSGRSADSAELQELRG